MSLTIVNAHRKKHLIGAVSGAWCIGVKVGKARARRGGIGWAAALTEVHNAFGWGAIVWFERGYAFGLKRRPELVQYDLFEARVRRDEAPTTSCDRDAEHKPERIAKEAQAGAS